MSTAVAYRAPSDSDTHHPSSSPHTLQSIESSTRPRGHYSPPSPMSSSPHRSQPGLAPRPSVEIVKTATSQNPQSGPNSSPNESRSLDSITTPQTAHHDPSEDVQSSQIPVPSVEVKQEHPPTPEPAKTGSAPSSRHRPRKLDLTTSVPVGSGRPSAPMTAKDSAPLTAMQDIGLACLSPGFQTEDPRMSQQLQRSMDLREEQRRIIESRLQKGGKEGEPSGSKSSSDNPTTQSSMFSKPPGTSKRKGPPPGLSITAPSAHQFASEPRVIQSAPLNQTFTGLNNKSNAHPLSRQVLQNSHKQQQNIPERRTSGSAASDPQYATYASNTQSANRLPPIQDVFANENLGSSSSPYRPTHSLHRANSGPGTSSNGQNGGPIYAPINSSGNQPSRSPNTTQYAATLPSPAYPPAQQSAGLHPPSNGRHHSARDHHDEPGHTSSGKRDDLFPKIIHYGGHQPPTPPSPLPPGAHSNPGSDQRQYGPSPLKADGGAPRNSSGRRRTRDEYERDYDDREDVERMELDGDRDRDRPRNVSGTSQRGVEAGAASNSNSRTGPGFGFGFGTWSGDATSRHSPDTLRRKKEEFIALCSRAWDLLHE